MCIRDRDPQTTDSILALLKDLSKRMGLTVIVITHEMRVIEEICTRVAVIADHHIAEVGTVKEVFTQPKTEAARRLVYREEGDPINFKDTEGTQLRITFEGGDAFEPILAELILETREPVNILHADTRVIDDCVYLSLIHI